MITKILCRFDNEKRSEAAAWLSDIMSFVEHKILSAKPTLNVLFENKTSEEEKQTSSKATQKAVWLQCTVIKMLIGRHILCWQ